MRYEPISPQPKRKDPPPKNSIKMVNIIINTFSGPAGELLPSRVFEKCG